MALINCKDCGKEVSKSAKSCPHCGTKLKKSKLLLIIGGGFLFLVFLGMLGEDKSKAPGSVASAAKPAEQAISVDISDLLSTYKGNEVGADNLYKDRWVQTTGVVGAVKKGFSDDLYVTVGTGAMLEIPTLQAFFNESANSQLAGLKKGQEITVICKISGLMMNVLGKRCEIR